MKNQKLDALQTEEETHGRDGEDSDHYSSSESLSNITKSIPKIKHGNCKEKAVSSTAKRNTREKNIPQKFSELSSMVPGCNKGDEDLMLDNAISYKNLLNERENILEEQKKNTFIPKAWAFGDNNIGESSISIKALPEIETKARGKDVLIKVHCENQEGCLTKVLGEIEKLHLNVENISSMTFGDYFLDVTVTAKMGDEFFMNMKDLKRELRETLQQLM